MKRFIRYLIGFLILIQLPVYSAGYMSLPYSFQPRQLISASKIMSNYNGLRNAIIDGTKKINVAQLFINNSLVIDNDLDITAKDVTLTGTLNTSSSGISGSESINNKIDVYNEYIAEGQEFSDVITFLNANLDNKYDLAFVEQVVTLDADAIIPTNCISVSVVRGGCFELGDYDLTLSGQIINEQNTFKLTGTGTVTGNIKNEMISPRMFSAVSADGIEDNDEILNTFNLANSSQISMIYIDGDFDISVSINVILNQMSRSNAGNRIGGLTVTGQGPYTSIIRYSGTDYGLNILENRVDKITFKDMQFETITGGSVKTGDVGQIFFNNVFFNGSATPNYALYMDGDSGGGFGVYNVDISDCRFWRSNALGGMKGGAIYINNFHTFHLKDTFVSQQWKDGDVIYINDGKNLRMTSVALEGANDATTTQNLVKIEGTIRSGLFENIYIEGDWNKGFYLSETSGQRNLEWNKVFAWDRGSTGDKSIIDTGNGSHRFLKASGITYLSDATIDGGGYILNNPNGYLDYSDFENISADSSQQNRAISQIGQTSNDRIKVALGATATPTASFTLGPKGSYDVDVALISADNNHGYNGNYRVIYGDSGSTYKWIDSALVTQNIKGTVGVQPSAINLTVSTNGTVLVDGTVPASNSWNWYIGYKLINKIEY